MDFRSFPGVIRKFIRDFQGVGSLSEVSGDFRKIPGQICRARLILGHFRLSMSRFRTFHGVSGSFQRCSGK